MHWLAQSLRKVKFSWNQVSLWQHRILREKNLTLVICFLLLLKGEIKKKCLTLAAYFLHLETPGLSVCYPLRIMSSVNRGSFTFSFANVMLFLSSSFCLWLKLLVQCGMIVVRAGILVLFLILQGKLSIFHYQV